MPLKHIEGVEWWQVLVYEDPKPDLLGNIPPDTVEVPDDMLARWAGAFRAFCEMQREMAKVLTGERPNNWSNAFRIQLKWRGRGWPLASIGTVCWAPSRWSRPIQP